MPVVLDLPPHPMLMQPVVLHHLAHPLMLLLLVMLVLLPHPMMLLGVMFVLSSIWCCFCFWLVLVLRIVRNELNGVESSGW